MSKYRVTVETATEVDRTYQCEAVIRDRDIALTLYDAVLEDKNEVMYREITFSMVYVVSYRVLVLEP